jgi:hypothetical protein
LPIHGPRFQGSISDSAKQLDACTAPKTKNHLVGGFNHLEKYEFVNGKDYPIYKMENKSNVSATNQ